MMRSIRFTVLFLLGSASFIRADLLTVNNLTQTDVCVATYYKDSAISRVGKPVLVKKQSSAVIERPKRKLWCNRELVFDYSKTILDATMPEARWRDIKHKNIGLLSGDTFFIVKDEGELVCHTSFEWNYLEPIKQWFNESYSLVIEPLIQTLKEDLPAIANNPHKDHIALVRDSNELHPAEKLCVSRRRARAKVALEKMIRQSVDQERMPTIAIVASGGGYRAMISTVGSLLAAERIGLLDSTIYISALSGSTWTLCSWYATGLPLKLFRPDIIDKMNNPVFPISADDMALITEAIVVKLAFGQPVTLVDVYGALLANVLLSDFGNNRHRIYLSDQVKRIKHGEWPFPIYTAIRAEEDALDGWYEFTPFEVGGHWIGRYVPTWAYGRKFANGTSIDYAPEQSLGFQMGTFGSAFAARISEIYDTIKDNIPSALVRELIGQLVMEEVGSQRLTYAEVFNYVQDFYRDRIEDLERLRLADGGSEPGFNLPYPVVSGEREGRKADVLIFLDMSSDAHQGTSLFKAEAYARAHGLKFPTISLDSSVQQACHVFKDDYDPEVPLVIYLPLVNEMALWAKFGEPGLSHFMPYVQNFDVQACIESGDCRTFDVMYGEQESNQLSKLTEFNLLANKEKITNAISWKTKQLGAVL